MLHASLTNKHIFLMTHVFLMAQALNSISSEAACDRIRGINYCLFGSYLLCSIGGSVYNITFLI